MKKSLQTKYSSYNDARLAMYIKYFYFEHKMRQLHMIGKIDYILDAEVNDRLVDWKFSSENQQCIKIFQECVVSDSKTRSESEILQSKNRIRLIDAQDHEDTSFFISFEPHNGEIAEYYISAITQQINELFPKWFAKDYADGILVLGVAADQLATDFLEQLTVTLKEINFDKKLAKFLRLKISEVQKVLQKIIISVE